MHLARWSVIAFALMLLVAPTLGASQSDYADCTGNDPDRGVAGCTRIIDDASASPQTRAIAFVGRGLAWRYKGELERAIADFDQAIGLDPSNADAYYTRGQTRMARGDINRGVADFSAGVRVNPKVGYNAYMRFASWYDDNMRAVAIDKNALERAIAEFSELIRRDPNDIAAYYSRGFAWYVMGEKDRATTDVGAAVRLELAATLK
jgi:tetratricopeptide (TPR) repeat protein